jgi:exonuclease III
MAQQNVNLVCWNVRGLNNKVHRDAVRDIVRDSHATIVCLQETKLDLVDDALIRSLLGQSFVDNYMVLPASGTRGGMILALSDSYFTLSDPHATPGSISATVNMRSEGTCWTITCVYGPQGEPEKLAFIEELKALQPLVRDEWLLLGDFNLITKASDKNNQNINRRLIGKFRGALDFLHLKELRLCGRRFTWSNEQENPVLTKIDHVFHSDDWDVLFPNAHLQAIPSASSDHAPLFLQGDAAEPRKPSFKFEAFWIRQPGFKETVASAWNKHVRTSDPVRRIHIKLSRTAKALKKWQRQNVGILKSQIALAKEIIWRLDLAEEERPLSNEERILRRHLKASYLGLLAIQKIKLRQRARLTCIRVGDTNSKLFHARINGRRRKNFIQTLQSAEGIAIARQDKENVILHHFKQHLGMASSRRLGLDWANLHYVPRDLSELEVPFDEQEIRAAVFSLPSVRAPGPDGFIGAFFKSCWDVLKGDLVAAILHLAALRGDYTNLINSANIILLPKKADAASVSDYRPISLIHSISKIFSKLMANRLAPILATLVSNCQSAFVQKRCIQDNFMYVQNLIRELHRSNKPSLFLKLDISKAFDSVSWAYLLEVLQNLGFGQRWRDWICLLLSTASSRVLLNGIPGTPFAHGCGLRQGDPLSPMLFIMAIDPLQRILQLASESGILAPINSATAQCRISLYADDAGIFANPMKDELSAISSILELFGKSSGLVTNLAKSEIFPVRCDNINLQDILSDFPAKIASFPGKYLGLPLSSRRLRKVDFQPLFDKIASRLPGWIGKNLARTGRTMLAKSVLTATAIFYLTAINLPKWVRDKIEKIIRNFIWRGDEGEHASGGHSLVNWKTVCRPKALGGLGIADLGRFGRALRLRWPWLEWTDPERPWVGSKLPCDDTDMNLFRASTTITLGDGNKALFWHDNWSGRGPIRSWAPELFKIATRKNRSVNKEMHDNNWIRSIARLSSPAQLIEYINLWMLLSETHLDPGHRDTISWKWTADGSYTASSAYMAQFHGSFNTFSTDKIWKAHAEPKCRFFSWLVLQGRILTADNLAKRGWPHDPICQLCLCAPETPTHLCKDCPFTMAIWNQVRTWLGMGVAPSQPVSNFPSIDAWWDAMLIGASKTDARRLSGRFLYVIWNAWKERNRRIFNGMRLTYIEVANLALEDIQQRELAFGVHGRGLAVVNT